MSTLTEMNAYAEDCAGPDARVIRLQRFALVFLCRKVDELLAALEREREYRKDLEKRVERLLKVWSRHKDPNAGGSKNT